jgi:hypothetical protein
MASAIAVLAVAAWIARPFLGLSSPDALSSAAPVPAAATPPAVEAPPERPPETVSQAGGETILPQTTPAAAPAAPSVQRPVQRPPAPPATETRVAQAPARETAVAAAAQPTPVPAVGVIRGIVRDAQSGAALAGVHISIPGTSFTATTDASGQFALTDVPAGRVALAAAGDGRLPGSREVVLETGATAQVDITLAAPAPAVAEPPPVPAAAPPAARPTVAPAARSTDDELTTGGWTETDAPPAAAQLRDRIATIPELWIESIATSQSGSRPRARVALLTASGERIVLTQTRSGAPAVGGAPRVTALRIIPASEAYPLTTGTASFGSLLVTAKTTLAGDALRALLGKLAPLE